MTHKMIASGIMVLLLFSSSLTPSKAKQYTGYKVIRVEPKDETQLKILSDLEQDENYELEFWGELIGNHSIDILVPPHSYDVFTDVMETLGIPFDIHQKDVQYNIDHENDDVDDDDDAAGKNAEDALNTLLRRSKRAQQVKYTIVGKFARHAQINEWLDSKATEFGDIASVEDIGHTYEGRSMKIIKIGRPGVNKPAIWIDAGIHAREWIAPATAAYVIDQLLQLYGKDDVINYLVDTYDWFILPVANPDGYEFSHTEDRLWRKNRRPNPSNTTSSNPRCDGVDLNRNFDYNWNNFCGSNLFGECHSENPCSAIYSGTHPFSEPESRVMRDFLLRHKSQLRMYMSFHSYSQLWLMPWGCCYESPENELLAVADAGMAALKKVHRINFDSGSPAVILYQADGISMDWAKAVAGIKYAYTLELRDRGDYGFLLPKSQVKEVGQEVMAGLVAAVMEMDLREEELEELKKKRR